MKLSPSTIAANLSAAAAAEAEAAANSNSTNANVASTSANTVSTSNAAPVSSGSNQMSTSLATTMASSTAPVASGSSNPPGKSTPKDTQVIAAILQEMGITDYEPRVLPQLVEFAYRKYIYTIDLYHWTCFINLLFKFCYALLGHASRVLEDAQLYSAYAKKKVIDTHDIQIATQMQMERSFVGPPPRGTLIEIARAKNGLPLPPIKSHNGMRLPADRYSLVAPNVRLVSKQNKMPKTGTSLLSKYIKLDET